LYEPLLVAEVHFLTHTGMCVYHVTLTSEVPIYQRVSGTG